MIIELSPNKIIPNALTVWNKPGPETDLVSDLVDLKFREGTIDRIYAFHVLDRLFLDDVKTAIANWKKLLKPGGMMFLIVDDFQYICRAYVGGDISTEQFNHDFSHPSYLDRELLVKLLEEAGFKDGEMVAWFEDVEEIFSRKHYELIISGQKNA